MSKIKFLRQRTLFNKSCANLLQKMSKKFLTPLDPQKFKCWGFMIWGHTEGPCPPYTTTTKLCLMGHVIWED